MKRYFKRFSRWTGATVILAFFGFLRILPLSIARQLTSTATKLGYIVLPGFRKRGMNNLDIAYGDTLSLKEKESILRESTVGLSILLPEFVHSHLLSTTKDNTFFTIEGYEHVDASRGAVLISGHLANWEWMCSIVGSLDQGLVAVARPMDDSRFDAYVKRQRTRNGLIMLDKVDAGRKIIQYARDGRLVGILVDQAARENAVPSTFFGKPCWATASPAMMAIRHETPIHPVCIIRDAKGHYTIRFKPAIPIERTGTLHEDLIRITQQCQDEIEEMVRANPGQWLWFHNRWKRIEAQELKWKARGVDLRFDS